MPRQRLKLHAPAAYQVVVERREAVGTQGVGTSFDPVALALGDRYPMRAANAGHLRGHVQVHLHRGRGRADDPDRQSRERGHPALCGNKEVLLPHRGQDLSG